ncbi:MAG: formylmethanofuran dehydrogenase subunit E family protein [Thermodesulfobacteriota bacterium]|nr:formylmethanofuran dehydrogenase subunit E family protein [Thermodesulfobacteriota bacterium]
MEHELRTIGKGQVEWIQRAVHVDYDNMVQQPLGFSSNGRYSKVIKLLGTFKGDLSPNDLTYLVKTVDGNTYNLYLHLSDFDPLPTPSPIQWTLDFRVLKRREAIVLPFWKLSTNMRLEGVADFHGDLCPELVLGCKACQMALELLPELNRDIMVIAENNSSPALDAIQFVLGCTVGNRKLKVIDHNRHVYLFASGIGGYGVKLSLETIRFDDENRFNEFERKVVEGSATLDDAVCYQRLLDDRVARLTELKNEEVFAVEKVRKCFLCNNFLTESLIHENNGFPICTVCQSNMPENNSNVTYQ